MIANMALQWLPCQAPGVTGSVLELADQVSEVADQNFHLDQSQYTDTRPTRDGSAQTMLRAATLK